MNVDWQHFEQILILFSTIDGNILMYLQLQLPSNTYNTTNAEPQ